MGLVVEEVDEGAGVADGAADLGCEICNKGGGELTESRVLLKRDRPVMTVWHSSARSMSWDASSARPIEA